MSELDRTNLFEKKAKINQIRNGIYSFITYFRKKLNKSQEETREMLHRMGKNIAKSFYNYWQPKQEEDYLKIMREVHRVVFKTSAKVREKDGYIIVINRGCPFCKYPRDADLAGCEIMVGFVVEYFNLLSADSDYTVPRLEGKVTKSQIFDEKFCQNVYKII
jgi:predicted hydrocarbon binding protein